MSLDNGNDTAPEIDDDLNTTAPQSKQAAWSMPEPVFRQTSGKLPQGYVRPTAPDPGSVEIDSVPPHAPSDTETETLPVASDPRPAHPTLKALLVILGLVAMIAFLAVFLTVVYFFFLRSSE